MSNESIVQDHFDIIIIGAGISGMVAAYNIWKRERSLNLLVLEANFRIGGRTLTVPLKGANNELGLFDLGGQWISTKQNVLMDLLNELDIKILATYNKGKLINHFADTFELSSTNAPQFGNIISKFELCKFMTKLEDLAENVTLLKTNGTILNCNALDFITMEYFIKISLQCPKNQNFMRNIIRTNCGVEASEISVLFYLAFSNGTQGVINQFRARHGGTREFQIKGGAQQICDKIATLIGWNRIKRNEAVVEMNQNENYVLIETENEIYKCNHAIIAIPPKEILKIKFTPSLSDRRIQFLNAIPCGHIIKFVITYETAFWRNRGYTGGILSCGAQTSPGPIHLCYDTTTSYNKPALAGYITTPDCFDESSSYRNEVLGQLSFYFGEAALTPIAYIEKRWWKERYVGGCPMSCIHL